MSPTQPLLSEAERITSVPSASYLPVQEEHQSSLFRRSIPAVGNPVAADKEVHSEDSSLEYRNDLR